jgi:hypothetical protein
MARKRKREAKPHEGLVERIHERIVAAEVAAEEAAEFGSPLTAAVEAAEGAIDPDREAREGDGGRKRRRGASGSRKGPSRSR